MSKYHGKKVGEIFETTDYTIFKLHPDNREIRPGHVKVLVKRMKEKGWIKSSTIKVNNRFQLIDGHHRFIAAQEVGVPVRYEVIVGATGDDIIDINTAQLRWSPFDHIQRHIKKGNTNYIELDKFIKKYPMFKLTECTMMCRNTYTSVDRVVFESGRYEVKSIVEAEKVANYLLQIRPFFEKGYNKSIFVRAVIKIATLKPEFDFERFLHKIRMRPGMIYLCGSVDLYIDMIEELYNYKSSNKLNLRF